MANTGLDILFLPAFPPYFSDPLIHKFKGVTWTQKLLHANPEPGTASIYLVFYYKGFHPTSLAVWLGSAAFSACLARTSDAVVPTLIAAFSCPRGCVPLGPPPFPVRVGITLLLPAGTR